MAFNNLLFLSFNRWISGERKLHLAEKRVSIYAVFNLFSQRRVANRNCSNRSFIIVQKERKPARTAARQSFRLRMPKLNSLPAALFSKRQAVNHETIFRTQHPFFILMKIARIPPSFPASSHTHVPVSHAQYQGQPIHVQSPNQPKTASCGVPEPASPLFL